MTQNEIFSKNLRHYLEKSGEKQADLARFLKVSTSTVSDWCSGKKLPRIGKIGKIAKHFGVEFTDLIGEGVYDDSDILMFYHVLSDEAKSQLISYASFLLSEETRKNYGQKKEEADHAEP